MIEGFKFRKLENGWTVKYYVVEENVGATAQGKFAGEFYVQTVADLQKKVGELFAKHMPESPR